MEWAKGYFPYQRTSECIFINIKGSKQHNAKPCYCVILPFNINHALTLMVNSLLTGATGLAVASCDMTLTVERLDFAEQSANKILLYIQNDTLYMNLNSK